MKVLFSKEAKTLQLSRSSGLQFQRKSLSWTHKKAGKLPLLTITSLGIALLVIMPIAVVAFSFFMPDKGIWRDLAASVLPNYIANTLYLVFLTSLGALIFGVSGAWLVTMCRFPGRRIFEWALVLPFSAPAYVLAYVYTDFLQHPGPVQTTLRDITGWGANDYWFPNIRSIEGAALVLSLVLYPYVYLLARAAFLEQCVCVLEASRSLGSSARRTFVKIALPMARPAIFGGLALVIMETLADFGAVSHFGVQTFTTGIYRAWFSMGDPVSAGRLSSLLLLFVVVVLMAEKWQRGKARFHQSARSYRQLPRYRLSGKMAIGAFVLCCFPLFFGFILPFSLLVWMHITGGHSLFGAKYLGFTANSVTLASLAAVLAVILALIMGYAVRQSRAKIMQISAFVANLGYAVPGTVIAVGTLIPLGFADRSLNALTQSWFGVTPGLILTGSIVALVYAYIVRFMPASLQSVNAGLVKIPRSLDDASRTLGHSKLETLRFVHFPLLRTSLLTAALIVFVDVLKELPATLIMRPFNFDTLAIQAYRLASDERLREAATPSLMIVLAGLIPVILLSYQIRKSRGGHRLETTFEGETPVIYD